MVLLYPSKRTIASVPVLAIVSTSIQSCISDVAVPPVSFISTRTWSPRLTCRTSGRKGRRRYHCSIHFLGSPAVVSLYVPNIESNVNLAFIVAAKADRVVNVPVPIANVLVLVKASTRVELDANWA
jgi:hypothetical protein